MYIETRFIYHNVGQGLFYSGEINSLISRDKFRFIYDCGSSSINKKLIEKSISNFLQDIENQNIENNEERNKGSKEEIDLLIISHLHSDHTSGLNTLLDKFKVNVVILPYFSPTERLLIAIEEINMGNRGSWYYEFLYDPIVYLLRKGKVDRVIIILGGKENERNEKNKDNKKSKDNEDNWGNKKIVLEDLPDFKNPESVIDEVDIKDWEKHCQQKQVVFKDHNGIVRAIGLWEFKFFNYYKGIPESKLKSFQKCVFQFIKSNKSIKEIIKDKEELKNLKSCYDELSRCLKSNLNNTSLVMYHGSIIKLAREYVSLYSPCFPFIPYPYFYGFECIENNYFGQLLIGDINLNMNYGELKKHYRNYLEKVLISQVPHHGAIKNWNEDIMKDTPNNRFWIISAGLKNRYGHPSIKVINNIISNKKECYWANETQLVIIESKSAYAYALKELEDF